MLGDATALVKGGGGWNSCNWMSKSWRYLGSLIVFEVVVLDVSPSSLSDLGSSTAACGDRSIFLILLVK